LITLTLAAYFFGAALTGVFLPSELGGGVIAPLLFGRWVRAGTSLTTLVLD